MHGFGSMEGQRLPRRVRHLEVTAPFMVRRRFPLKLTRELAVAADAVGPTGHGDRLPR